MYQILIVEDEEIIRKGLVYGVPWSEMDCSVIGEAANGVEGIHAIETLHPDIVLVDINMPILDGLEMLRASIDVHHFSAIILSGYSDFNYARTAVHLGVTEYLLKPIDREELKVAIENAKQLQSMKNTWLEEQKKQGALRNVQLLDRRTDEESDLVVRQMLKLIEAHYKEKLVMQDVMNELNYSETYLNKRFKKATGSTFNEYLNRFRIQKAVEILQDHEISPSEADTLCGFSTFKYFKNVFRKYMGCSPREFREIVRAQSEEDSCPQPPQN